MASKKEVKNSLNVEVYQRQSRSPNRHTNLSVRQSRSSSRSPANYTKVSIITTGGTIAQAHDETQGGAVPKLTGDQLVKAIPELDGLAAIEVVEYTNIDSRNVDLAFYCGLLRLIKTLIMKEDVSAVIVTHGTDTMEQTAYLLQRAIESKKPIILTGAMRAADQLSPDGPINIINSVLQAINREAINKGVTINFNGKIHSANYAFKCQSENVDAFASGEKGIIGAITSNKVIWYNTPALPRIIPYDLEKLQDVPVIFCSPGANYKYLKLDEIKGLVIVGYGCGNVNSETYELAEKAIQNGIVVVLVTMVQNGGVFAEYGGKGGVGSMEEIGVILANELNYWRARLALMLALSINNDKNDIKYYFSQH